jgi:hypothetical protein
MMDVDGSKSIDREEALKFWNKGFAKLSSNELFSQVDKNNDGSIQENEWIEFWTLVYHSGYTEDEILSELDNLINKGAWTKFETYEKKKTFTKKDSLRDQGKI